MSILKQALALVIPHWILPNYLLEKPHSHKQDVANGISMQTPHFFSFYTLIQNAQKGIFRNCIFQQVSEQTSTNCSPMVAVMQHQMISSASQMFLVPTPEGCSCKWHFQEQELQYKCSHLHSFVCYCTQKNCWKVGHISKFAFYSATIKIY
jgi:hypothetical protein